MLQNRVQHWVHMPRGLPVTLCHSFIHSFVLHSFFIPILYPTRNHIPRNTLSPTTKKIYSLWRSCLNYVLFLMQCTSSQRPWQPGVPHTFPAMWLNSDQHVQIIVAWPESSESYYGVSQMTCILRATTCKAGTKERSVYQNKQKPCRWHMRTRSGEWTAQQIAWCWRATWWTQKIPHRQQALSKRLTQQMCSMSSKLLQAELGTVNTS